MVGLGLLALAAVAAAAAPLDGEAEREEVVLAAAATAREVGLLAAVPAVVWLLKPPEQLAWRTIIRRKQCCFFIREDIAG